MSDTEVLICEVPTYKEFVLLVNQAKLTTDWFEEKQKKALQTILNNFHTDIAKYAEMNADNHKSNSKNIIEEIKTLKQKTTNFISTLKKKEDKTEKEKKFIQFVEGQIIDGAEKYQAKMHLLVHSRFSSVDNAVAKDERVNNDERLKVLGNPFIDYISKWKKFDFDGGKMTTDEHAIAYMESFISTVDVLTGSMEKLAKSGHKINGDEVMNKIQLMDGYFENFRKHIAKNPRSFPNAIRKAQSMKACAEEYKNAVKRIPIKMD